MFVSICLSNAYEIDHQSQPIKLKVLPVSKRIDGVSNADVKDGLSHNAIYTKEHENKLNSMSKDDRVRFLDARRQRRKKQATLNMLTAMNEYVFKRDSRYCCL